MRLYGVWEMGEGQWNQVPVAAPTPGIAKALVVKWSDDPWLDFLDLRVKVYGEIDGHPRVLSKEEAIAHGWEIYDEDDL